MQRLFIYFLLIKSGFASLLPNPSFEGIASCPDCVSLSWTKCLPGTPDVQPGMHGVLLTANHGLNYTGLVHDNSPTGNNYRESISAAFDTPLTTGIPYYFNIALADLREYDPSTWTVSGYLEVWGGNTNCDRAQLLWVSPQIVDLCVSPLVCWQNHNISFIPNANYTHLTMWATVTPSGLPLGSGFMSIGVDNISPILPLPIEELSLQLQLEADEVQITISTSLENLHHLRVERGIDTQSFSWLADITPTSSESLKFIDREPLSGTSYYRVIRVSQNGEEVVSHPQFIFKSFSSNDLILYPNPLPPNTQLQLHSQIAESFFSRLDISDYLGTVIKTQNIFITSGVIDLPWFNLSAGIYFMTLTESSTNKKLFTKKIIVE